MVAIYRLCRPRATVGNGAIMQLCSVSKQHLTLQVELYQLDHSTMTAGYSSGYSYDGENSGIGSVQTSDKLGRIFNLKFIKQWQFQYYNMTVDHG